MRRRVAGGGGPSVGEATLLEDRDDDRGIVCVDRDVRFNLSVVLRSRRTDERISTDLLDEAGALEACRVRGRDAAAREGKMRDHNAEKHKADPSARHRGVPPCADDCQEPWQGLQWPTNAKDIRRLSS